MRVNGEIGDYFSPGENFRLCGTSFFVKVKEVSELTNIITARQQNEGQPG